MPAPASQTERLNTALAGRYRIERHLGEGGMATVYLAEDLKHDRKVALKLLKPELAAVLGAERFVQEIKTTAALQHPHILPLFDSGTADGFLFYVMPFIEGETLRAKLDRETQLGVDDAVRIAREVLDALDYAHQHGIVHRDVKPENVLLHGGHAMVADFGIALAVSAAAGGRMTETGLSLGTPHYMSPEQATAEKEINARSDVYSLGSVLYEMLTGQPPHLGGSAQQIIMKIITEPAEPVTKHRKSVPPNVAAAVGKALEKLPADRFDSARAFSDALGNPGYTSAVHSSAVAQGTRGRGGVPLWLFAASATLAVAALVAALRARGRAELPRGVLRVSVLFPDTQRMDVAGSNNMSRLAISHDGRTIAYVGKGAKPTTTRLFVRRLDQLTATALAGTEAAGNPSFSPDGKFIAFVSETPRALKTVPTAGGPVVTLADSAVDLGGVSWGSDGYIYYDGKLTGDGLARIRPTGGSKPEIATMPDSASGERWHSQPVALPNGRGVIFIASRTGGGTTFEIAVLDSKTGKHKRLMRAQSAQYAQSGHLVYVTIGGALMAAPFDLNTLTITGEAVPMAEGVAQHGISNRGIDVAMSDSGLLTYVAGESSNGPRELVWVTREGRATAIDSQWKARIAVRPTLSPDGRRVAVSIAEGNGATSLWIKNLDGRTLAKVANRGTAAAWSPDGKTVVFSTPQGLMRAPADGSTNAAPFLPLAGELRTSGLEWSRDGKWLVYALLNADIVAVRMDGDATITKLVGTPAVERQPALSPDGRWLAYISDETGRYEVYVSPFPDTKVSKRQLSVNGGFTPRWSRDGRELFFADETQFIYSVPVAPGAVFAPGIPMRLFPASAYSVQTLQFEPHPDGRRFLMSRTAASETQRPDELVLVQNFFEELRAKVPGKK